MAGVSSVAAVVGEQHAEPGVGETCSELPADTSGDLAAAASGEAGYETGFIERYVLPVLYPSELARSTQLVLGMMVVVLNVAVYTWAWRRWGDSSRIRCWLS